MFPFGSLFKSKKMMDAKSELLSLKNCAYTQYYCEENIWHLCKQIKNLKLHAECYCVFVSNPNKQIILWKQKLADNADEFVIWDYHVIAVYGNHKEGYYVLDFDSSLPFPVSFKEYADQGIRSEERLMPLYQRFFRVIPAEDFLMNFSSDRRHMKIGDSWCKPPPKYPPIIQNQANPHNLDEFINMDREKGFGNVLNYQEFVARFKT